MMCSQGELPAVPAKSSVPEACGVVCSGEPKCFAFTLDSAAGTCRLFQVCSRCGLRSSLKERWFLLRTRTSWTKEASRPRWLFSGRRSESVILPRSRVNYAFPQRLQFFGISSVCLFLFRGFGFESRLLYSPLLTVNVAG